MKKTLPLSGVRVIEAATLFAAGEVGALLGDLGAEVIKIEHPSGDPLRNHGYTLGDSSLWWKYLSRNKRCITLDLSQEEGAGLFLQLAATADVVIENFRPGTMERWSCGPEQLEAENAGLILCRITGFGQTGPYSARAAFGTLAEAMSGFAHMNGQSDGPPTLPPFALADGVAGVFAALAITASLRRRLIPDYRREFQVIDISLIEPLMSLIGPMPAAHHTLGITPGRNGNRSSANAPRNVYLTNDGRWIAVSASSTKVAERVMTLVGVPEIAEEEWFRSGEGRVAHVDLIDQVVSEWIGRRSQEEVLSKFIDAGAAAAPIYEPADILGDPHLRERQTFREWEYEGARLPMQEWIFRGEPPVCQQQWLGRDIGVDNWRIYGEELGLTESAIGRLHAMGVV